MKIQKTQADQLRNKLSALTGHERLQAAAGSVLKRATAQTVYILIDCSDSMAGQKLNSAKQGAVDFAKNAQQQSHSIGLISFNSTAVHQLEPTRSSDLVERQLRTLTAAGSTNLTEAINLAFANFRDVRASRIIYVVTDGMPDDVGSALEAAMRAKTAGIKIMTLGTDDADRDFLANLSSQPAMSIKVARAELREGVASMVKLLGN